MPTHIHVTILSACVAVSHSQKLAWALIDSMCRALLEILVIARLYTPGGVQRAGARIVWAPTFRYL